MYKKTTCLYMLLLKTKSIQRTRSQKSNSIQKNRQCMKYSSTFVFNMFPHLKGPQSSVGCLRFQKCSVWGCKKVVSLDHDFYVQCKWDNSVRVFHTTYTKFPKTPFIRTSLRNSERQNVSSLISTTTFYGKCVLDAKVLFV